MIYIEIRYTVNDFTYSTTTEINSDGKSFNINQLTEIIIADILDNKLHICPDEGCYHFRHLIKNMLSKEIKIIDISIISSIGKIN